jgi:ATP-dependent RNA helicase DDX52/ROK1
MGSNIEQLARTVINERRTRITNSAESGCAEAPLVRLVVGLKDSAVPNIQHRLIYAASEQGKLMGLRQLLHPTTTTAESGPPLLPPFLVFTQTIERAVALHSELLYDIPPEAGGISRIAVLHSDLSDTARDSVMTKFRKGEIWVLITTDLLSRGVDFRGVNGVVNYDIPTSSAAYVHRVGRTGRAGREGGVAVTLYSKDDIPYLKNVANVVAMAQKQKSTSAEGTSEEGVQQWLLDALPNLTKQAKKDLRKHGIESRTAKGAKNDPKAARRGRISTKSGFERREENKRKGAIRGSKQRQEAAVADADAGDETDFGGFD